MGLTGLHIFSNGVTKTAEFSPNKILVGREESGDLVNGLRYTEANGLEVVGQIEITQQAIMDATGWETLPVSGAAKMNPRGVWTANTTWAVGDVVTYLGGSYMCKAGNYGSVQHQHLFGWFVIAWNWWHFYCFVE